MIFKGFIEAELLFIHFMEVLVQIETEEAEGGDGETLEGAGRGPVDCCLWTLTEAGAAATG